MPYRGDSAIRDSGDSGDSGFNPLGDGSYTNPGGFGGNVGGAGGVPGTDQPVSSGSGANPPAGTPTVAPNGRFQGTNNRPNITSSTGGFGRQSRSFLGNTPRTRKTSKLPITARLSDLLDYIARVLRG